MPHMKIPSTTQNNENMNKYTPQNFPGAVNEGRTTNDADLGPEEDTRVNSKHRPEETKSAPQKASLSEDSVSKGSLLREGRHPKAKYALISFVSKGRSKQLIRLSRSHRALGNICMLGRGVARSEILNYLALEVDEKEIVISHIRTDRAQGLLQALRKKMEMDRPGHGIAFLVPILESKGLEALFRFAKLIDQTGTQLMAKADPAQVSDEGIIFGQHDLIMATLQSTVMDDAVVWAREAGAAGGTILSSRNTGSQETDEACERLGLEPEQELLMMLVRKNKTQPILHNLFDRPEIYNCAKNTAFVLPVSAVIGLAHRLVVAEDGSVTEQAHSTPRRDAKHTAGLH